MTVDEYLAAHPDAAQLRNLVLTADPRLVENIKWNSPNFVLDGVDRLTINAGRSAVRLILHMGVDVPEDKSAPPLFDGDPDGLLTWHSNLRASLAADGEPEAMLAVIRAWLRFAG